MARPKFAAKSTSSRGPITKPHHLPHPWTASGSDSPFFHSVLDRPTDRPTYVRIRTYGQTDISFTGKFDDYIARSTSNKSDAAIIAH